MKENERKIIIQNICERYYIEKVFDYNKYFQKDLAGEVNLGEGSAGIIIFLLLLQKQMKIDCEELLHEFIKLSVKKIEREGVGISLYDGITGFNYALFLLNRETGNYTNLLSKLDNMLFLQLKYYLRYLKSEENRERECYWYDVISGLSGIMLYILQREGNPETFALIEEGIKILLLLSGGAEKWLVRSIDKIQDKLIIGERKDTYNLGLAHGIIGPLIILSKCIEKGIIVAYQKDAISEWAEWLKLLYTKYCGKIWPSSISQNNEEKGGRIGWCYGNLDIALGMKEAGQALKNQVYYDTGSKIFNEIFSIPIKKWFLLSPIICHGYAGVHEMLTIYSEDKSRSFQERMIDGVIGYINYDQNHFFNSIDGDKPDFLSGALGNLSVLLGELGNENIGWNKVLMI